jgi:predicted transcriptional regulator
MPRVPTSLGQAELEILQIVQDHQPVTVGEVARRVADDSGKARTTVATMVGRLLTKGFLSRKKIEGKYHYTARMSKTDLHRGLVQRFVDGSLGGSLSPFVAYLAEKPDLTAEEIDRLEQLVQEMKPRAAGGRK